VNDRIELRVEDLTAGYGQLQVLHDLSFSVDQGELVVITGPNGAGKTTLMLALMGLLELEAGRVRVGEVDLAGLSVGERLRSGLALVPEGRGLFPSLTVWENLRVACKALGLQDDDEQTAMAAAAKTFPIIGERLQQTVRSLSGGEQQMVAIARSLLGDPRVLLLDEPSIGLAPIIWAEVLEICRGLADAGRVVVLVEQRVLEAVGSADRCIVMHQGRVADERPGGPETAADPELLREYFALENGR
jgi:branched-chain amino acid transport system ATP-binding protein